MLIAPMQPLTFQSPKAALDVPGTVVHENMLAKLNHLEVVKDAAELTGPDAVEHLEELGFTREKSNDEYTSYTLGRAHLHGAGQRAIFRSNGSYQLVTFAGQFVQLTHLDAEGRRVSNAVERLPG